MSAIWLLSSRGRPREAQATINACMDAGMTSRGVLYVDETVEAYLKLKLPSNWTVHYEADWLSLQGSMGWCLRTFPDASAYGWLADDTRPRTKGWDRILELNAGDYRFAYARDLWLSEDAAERGRLEDGHNCSSGLCWGGELVRSVGWWALPGVRQAGIDTAWLALCRPLGLQRYVHEVTVEHLNWRTGKRPKDAGDEWERDGDDYVQQDLIVARDWLSSSAYRQTLKRVSGRHRPLGEGDSLLPALRQSLLDEMWRGALQLPAARLQRIQQGDYDALIYSQFLDPDPDS